MLVGLWSVFDHCIWRSEQARSNQTSPGVFRSAGAATKMQARFKMELATFQPSKRDLAAIRMKVVHIPPRPSHAARGKLLAAGVFACDSADQPRWAAEVAARRQSFAIPALVVDRGSEGVSMWKFVCFVQASVCVGLCRMVLIPHDYERRNVTRSTWVCCYERAFCRIFKDNFVDASLASDVGDVETCRIEELQRIHYVGGTRVVCRDPAVDFLAFFGKKSTCRRSCHSRPGWRALKRESNGSWGRLATF